MTDLKALLDDLIANRLSWMTIRREKEEALLTGIVAEIEALKEKRGPGRPPKAEAA